MSQNESRLSEAEKQIEIVCENIDSPDAIEGLEQARDIIREVREAEMQPVESV